MGKPDVFNNCCRYDGSDFTGAIDMQVVYDLVMIDIGASYDNHTEAFKATPHDPCASDAKSRFSSDCLNSTQAGWRPARRIVSTS